MADEEGILIVKARRIVLPDSIVSGCLVVKNGKIVGIESGDGAIPRSSGAKVIEVVLECKFCQESLRVWYGGALLFLFM